MPEFWTNLSAVNPWHPDHVAERAVALEADGWDGGTLVDTQNIAADPYVCLAVAAKATTRLRLATGVSNAVTRHPAVTAAAMASLQVVSGGRAVLGIGRGDSALAYLGASPMPLGSFEQYLGLIQRYLRGETIPLDEVMPTVHATRTGYDHLALGHAPEGSRLTWLPDDLKKVPMDVAVTGPKAIGVAARVAERITFAVGADMERLTWAINTANDAAAAAGRNPAEISFGAYVSVMPHEDIEVARELVSGAVSGIARFSIMNKKIMGPTSAHQRETLEKLAAQYNMNQHGRAGSQESALDDEFIDGYAVVGEAAACRERLSEILGLGFDRLVVFCGAEIGPQGRHSYEILINNVLPALRA